uniref:delta-60 repeat domain-containing protein n=1 Tax=Mucilaginibacter sp. dw_454 TaxID=2720079 RepID=UPI001C4A760B
SGNNAMIVTGDFTFYTSRVYNQNTYDFKDSTIIDSTICNRIARIKDNGYLDSTWRFDKNAPGYKNTKGASLPGPNGPIQSLQDEKGNILLYGQYTSFDGAPVNSIVRIDPTSGLTDPSFKSGGTTQRIERVSYNATLKKYLVVGDFLTFDGKATPYMVRLNYDGSVDNTFTSKVFDGGVPNFVKLLNDGLAVVGGTFRSYDGVIRNGFAVIDATGALADGYNSIGNVNGSIYNVYETTSADNKRALLIMGSFSLFDNVPKNNIVRVTFQ